MLSLTFNILLFNDICLNFLQIYKLYSYFVNIYKTFNVFSHLFAYMRYFCSLFISGRFGRGLLYIYRGIHIYIILFINKVYFNILRTSDN